MNRFERGLQNYLTPPQRSRVQDVSVGIGGAGGLGSNVAVALVRCGFRQFEVLDFDTVSDSNLNRQFYFLDDIGQAKVDALRKHLTRINPDVDVTVHHVRWSPENGKTFFQNCSVIVEAFDRADIKKSFVEYYASRRPLIVSGVGMAGTNRKTPMAVKRIGNIYFVGDGTSDIHDGLPPMATRVLTCAAMMAEVILDLTLAGEVRSAA
jgi:sulfur carrier protein ThiS adenylyltransferase